METLIVGTAGLVVGILLVLFHESIAQFMTKEPKETFRFHSGKAAPRKAKVVVFLVGIGLILSGSLSVSFLLSSEIFVNHALSETDFLPWQYELFIADTNIKVISPRQPYEKLFVRVKYAPPDTGREISSPKDLVGKVHITTPPQALQYARLFTSPDIGVRLEGDAWGEVVPISTVDLRYFFGNKELLKSRKEDPEAIQQKFKREAFLPPDRKDRFGGVLTDREWQANGFRAPEVKPLGRNFIVKRTLFKVPPEKDYTCQIYWVEEKISPNGELTRRILSEVKIKDKIQFWIPRERY